MSKHIPHSIPKYSPLDPHQYVFWSQEISPDSIFLAISSCNSPTWNFQLLGRIPGIQTMINQASCHVRWQGDSPEIWSSFNQKVPLAASPRKVIGRATWGDLSASPGTCATIWAPDFIWSILDVQKNFPEADYPPLWTMLFNVWCKQHWEPNLSGGFTKNTKNKWWLKCRDPTAVKLYRAYHDGFLAKPNNISLQTSIFHSPNAITIRTWFYSW